MNICKINVNKKIKKSNIPLVIGYFNCIHCVHQQLLNKFFHFNVLTFNDSPHKENNKLYTFTERISNISSYNPQTIYIFDINKTNMTAKNFIDNILLKINPSRIVVGANFNFGYDHQGIDLLKRYFKVDVFTHNKNVSTTQIIKLIKANKISQANDFLSIPYYYISKQISGEKKGRKIGIKTINLSLNHPIFLNDGVYITRVWFKSKVFNSVAFLGFRKKRIKYRSSNVRSLEIHILNSNSRYLFFKHLDILAWKNIKVEFLSFIRQNKLFNHTEDLIKQINNDKQIALNYFKNEQKS